VKADTGQARQVAERLVATLGTLVEKVGLFKTRNFIDLRCREKCIFPYRSLPYASLIKIVSKRQYTRSLNIDNAARDAQYNDTHNHIFLESAHVLVEQAVLNSLTIRRTAGSIAKDAGPGQALRPPHAA
jgi:hypothetical protein